MRLMNNEIQLINLIQEFIAGYFHRISHSSESNINYINYCYNVLYVFLMLSAHAFCPTFGVEYANETLFIYFFFLLLTRDTLHRAKSSDGFVAARASNGNWIKAARFMQQSVASRPPHFRYSAVSLLVFS